MHFVLLWYMFDTLFCGNKALSHTQDTQIHTHKLGKVGYHLDTEIAN